MTVQNSALPPRKLSASLSWEKLIAKAKSGCPDAMQTIIDRTYDYLLLVANQGIGTRLQSKFGASDIVQVSLTEACEQFGSFEGKGEIDVRAWFKRIVTNNLIDQSRFYLNTQRRSVHREQPLGDGNSSTYESKTLTASGVYRLKQLDEQLKMLVARLPKTQREVIELRHRDQMSHSQIAERLGITAESARQHWSRGTRQLQAWLKENG